MSKPASLLSAGRGRRRARTRLALLAAALTLSSACYRTLPLHGPPDPGIRVVAGLTREGTERMYDQIGADVIRVEAETGQISTDQWTLLLVRTWDRNGREYPWAREMVTFPTNYLVDARTKEFDRRRTWITAGAVVAGIVMVGRAFVKGFFGGSDGEGPEPPVH